MSDLPTPPHNLEAERGVLGSILIDASMGDSRVLDLCIENGITDAEAYINPIPAGLVLTGIVVAVASSAVMLALTVRLYERYHTLDIDKITSQARKEE